MTRRYDSIEERFVKYVDDSGDCWVWTGACRKGYGTFRLPHHGKMIATHRWFWEYVFGTIPSGKILCHTCDNPPCVRLDHLYIGTDSTNSKDRMERNPDSAPPTPSFSIPKKEWYNIKEEYKHGVSVKILATKYNVSTRTIYKYIRETL